MTKRRGRIVTKQGYRHDVPERFLDEEIITWPPELSGANAATQLSEHSQDNFYRRHEIVPGEAYLYLPIHETITDVPDAIIKELLDGTN